MPDSGKCRRMNVMSVREDGALVQQASDSTGVGGPETRQIIVAELVDYDGHNQPGRLRRGTLRVLSGHGKREKEKEAKQPHKDALSHASRVACNVLPGGNA